MSVTITRAQRDALYEEILAEVTGIGDIYLCLDRGDGEQARGLWERFAPQLRILEAIGWAPGKPREEFRLDVPLAVLGRAIATLQARAEQAVGAHISEPKDGLAVAQRGLQVLGACRSVLRQLARREGERS